MPLRWFKLRYIIILNLIIPLLFMCLLLKPQTSSAVDSSRIDAIATTGEVTIAITSTVDSVADIKDGNANSTGIIYSFLFTVVIDWGNK